MTFDIHESGRPGAPTILLSSGLGGVAGYWAPQLAALTARYRVVAYDQEGTGRARSTQLPDGYRIADMAEQVVDILDATDTETCHFVGHALGGLVGLELALTASRRLRSLTVVNGWAKADAHTRRCFEIRTQLLEHAGPEAYARAQPIFLYPATWLAANERRMVQEDAHAISGFQGAGNLLRRIAALLAFDATERLGELDLPTFLMAARDDVLVPCSQSERLAGAIRGATLHVSEWGAHGMNVSDPERFNQTLLRFLDGC